MHDADEEADAELLHDEQREVLEPVGVRLLDPGDQPEGERDRHRVVPAGLRLERPRDPAADVRRAERREDGSRVGRGDDRAEQERLEPGDVEQRVRGDAGQQRADDDPDRAEERRRHCDLAQPPPRGLQPALVEDQREADDAHLARELGVVELDSARAVRAEQHPEAEERDENGEAGARRAERDDDARRQNARRPGGGEGPRPWPHPSCSSRRAADGPARPAARPRLQRQNPSCTTRASSSRCGPADRDGAVTAGEDLAARQSQLGRSFAGRDELRQRLAAERIDDPSDPRPVDRAGAHRARLGARVQRAALQSALVETTARGAHEVQLRVARDVVLGQDGILGLQHHVTTESGEECTEGMVAVRPGGGGERDRPAQVVLVGGGHEGRARRGARLRRRRRRARRSRPRHPTASAPRAGSPPHAGRRACSLAAPRARALPPRTSPPRDRSARRGRPPAGAVEIALTHPAVAELDALELRMAEPDEVEPALVEDRIADRCFRELRAGQPAVCTTRRRALNRSACAPAQSRSIDDRVDQIREIDLRKRHVRRVRRVGGYGVLRGVCTRRAYATVERNRRGCVRRR